MVRISKKDRNKRCPRKPKYRPLANKTGPLKDKLPLGFKEQVNAVAAEEAQNCFIPKIKSFS